MAETYFFENSVIVYPVFLCAPWSRDKRKFIILYKSKFHFFSVIPSQIIRIHTRTRNATDWNNGRNTYLLV